MRRMRRTLRGAAAMARLATWRRALTGVAAACLTYCSLRAGASATCTAPPPTIAPPAASAASFAMAIRTDISFAFYTLVGSKSGNRRCRITPVVAFRLTAVNATMQLTLFFRQRLGKFCRWLPRLTVVCQSGTKLAAFGKQLQIIPCPDVTQRLHLLLR